MRARSLTRVAIAAAFSATALTVAPVAATAATPAAAVAHPDFSQATGSESPPTVKPGGKVNLGLDCVSTSSDAAATGTEIGLPSAMSMHKSGNELFGLTLTVPKTTKQGTYHISMQCADGSFTTVKFTVTAAGGSA
jgi:hypothetical protein